jgi:hypothetical protein
MSSPLACVGPPIPKADLDDHTAASDSGAANRIQDTGRSRSADGEVKRAKSCDGRSPGWHLGAPPTRSCGLREFGVPASIVEYAEESGHPGLSWSAGTCSSAPRNLGDRRGEAYTIHSMGHIRRDQGRSDDAAGLFARCVPIFRQLGDRLGEVHTAIKKAA